MGAVGGGDKFHLLLDGIMASIVTPGLKDGCKPDLISIINGFEGDVHDAVFLTKQNYILTSSDDRLLHCVIFLFK